MRADTGKRVVFDGGDLAAALAKLDKLAETASFVLGHNLIAFDLPHLQAANPDLRLLSRPVIDTLRLSPLAFPRNPYHHLVKHYQDGGLKRGRVNNPELDARLTLQVFEHQRLAMDYFAMKEADFLERWMPVRAFCELHGIPAQMGNEEIPGFWRLRETRAFVDWLCDRENGVVDGKALQGWVNACAPNAWNGLLRQAIDEHELETGGAEAPALKYSYLRPPLEDVDLGFAGRQNVRRPVHRAIAELTPGDPLRTRIASGGRWELLSWQGMLVGRMAASFKPPTGTRCRSASVLAVMGWSREASDPKYHDRMRCDAWEVIVPELVFEPEHQSLIAQDVHGPNAAMGMTATPSSRR